MSSFSLHIATDNAAFRREDDPADTFTTDTAEELARMLRGLADRLESWEGVDGTLRDANGNRCGRWFWTDRTQTHDDAAALDAMVPELEQALEAIDDYGGLGRLAEWVRRTGREVST